MKVLTIGGATQDIFIAYEKAEVAQLDRDKISKSYLLLEQGRKIEVDQIEYHVGGGAANAAVSLKKLGHESSVVAAVGNDHQADFIVRYLQQQEVRCDYIARKDDLQTATSFILAGPSGDAPVLVYRGAVCSLSVHDVPIDALGSFDQLYITSLCGQAEHLLPEIARKAHGNKCMVTVNPGSSQLIKNTQILVSALPTIDTLILNAYEARLLMAGLLHYLKVEETASKSSIAQKTLPELLRAPLVYKNIRFNLHSFFRTILNQGPSVVVVTNGADGVYLATGATILYHPALYMPVVSTVGAGDAFGSTLTALRGNRWTLEESLCGAMINAASVIGQIGTHAGLLSLRELQGKLVEQGSDSVQRFSL